MRCSSAFSAPSISCGLSFGWVPFWPSAMPRAALGLEIGSGEIAAELIAERVVHARGLAHGGGLGGLVAVPASSVSTKAAVVTNGRFINGTPGMHAAEGGAGPRGARILLCFPCARHPLAGESPVAKPHHVAAPLQPRRRSEGSADDWTRLGRRDRGAATPAGPRGGIGRRGSRARQRSRGKLTVRERIDALLDPGSFRSGAASPERASTMRKAA